MIVIRHVQIRNSPIIADGRGVAACIIACAQHGNLECLTDSHRICGFEKAGEAATSIFVAGNNTELHGSLYITPIPGISRNIRKSDGVRYGRADRLESTCNERQAEYEKQGGGGFHNK